MLALLSGLLAGALHVVTGPDHLAAVAPLSLRRGGWRSGTGDPWGPGDEPRHPPRTGRQLPLPGRPARLRLLVPCGLGPALLREVSGHKGPVYSRTVDTHVQRLRAKLGPARERVETVRGAGYRLRAD